jgi:haloalkane dehalogenase
MISESMHQPMFPGDQFASHYATVNGLRMHYIDEGQGDAVVLVHGNPTWWYYFRNLITVLRKRFRVIVPDHIGSGMSDKPRSFEYTLKNHIDNLAALFDRLHLSTTSLVLHDWGGAIGLGAAAQREVGLEKLVILNTAAFRSNRIPLRIRVCRWPLIGALLVKGCNAFARGATFMAVAQPMKRDLAAAYVKPYTSWKTRIGVHEFVKDIPLHPRHRSYQTLVDVERYVDRLAGNPPEMAIIWGGRDFCFNDHFYHEWRRRFPAAHSHYFDDCGHYILEDGAGRVEPLIENFLSGSST